MYPTTWHVGNGYVDMLRVWRVPTRYVPRHIPLYSIQSSQAFDSRIKVLDNADEISVRERYIPGNPTGYPGSLQVHWPSSLGSAACQLTCMLEWLDAILWATWTLNSATLSDALTIIQRYVMNAEILLRFSWHHQQTVLAGDQFPTSSKSWPVCTWLWL